jgi:hypothetical protein
MFYNFYLVKNHKIANNSATTEGREKNRPILGIHRILLMYLWLNCKTMKLYVINLARFLARYLVGERASLKFPQIQPTWLETFFEPYAVSDTDLERHNIKCTSSFPSTPANFSGLGKFI